MPRIVITEEQYRRLYEEEIVPDLLFREQELDELVNEATARSEYLGAMAASWIRSRR